MPALKYKVELNESERTHLKQIGSRGETSARKVKRALVLLKADEGLTDRDIGSGLLISASTVGRVRVGRVLVNGGGILGHGAGAKVYQSVVGVQRKCPPAMGVVGSP